MNDNLEFLDVLNIISFVIGYLNYTDNQTDKSDLMDAINNSTNRVIAELNYQNTLLKSIIIKLEEYKNDN